MPKEAKRLLTVFLSQDSRLVEESFCRLITGRPDTRLFFILEGKAYTDGRQIVVDPTLHNIYFDKPALQRIEAALNTASGLRDDPLLALRIITRSQSCHEALHILFTPFPAFTAEALALRAQTRYRSKVLHLLHNIAEDAYIEAAGGVMFDNMAPYLIFGRLANVFAAAPEADTVQDVFGDLTKRAMPAAAAEDDSNVTAKLMEKLTLTTDFLDHAASLLLSPFGPVYTPDALTCLCQKTDPLLEEAARTGDARTRTDLVLAVFDLLEDILPDIPDEAYESVEILFQRISTTIGPTSLTHEKAADGALANEVQAKSPSLAKGVHEREIGPGVFDRDREELRNLEWLFGDDSAAARAGVNIAISNYASIPGSQLAGDLHEGITVSQIHPVPDIRLSLAYDGLVKAKRGVIGRMQRRFAALILESVSLPESRHLFGSRIVSRDLGRPDGRIWERAVPAESIVPLSVCLLIDGSGSMHGQRIDMARETAVIIRETLTALNLPWSCVVHHAGINAYQVEMVVLNAFSDPEDYRLNLMQIRAGGGNRDGLALAWARNYLRVHAPTERKLLLVISDGMPMDIGYYGDPALEDTGRQARLIQRDGIAVVAIALDDPGETECYDQVRTIYRHTVACDDLSLLPRHLLKAIARHIT
ncbi:MAG TPA: VWA domain-containing protein [Clostridiaceae bacterium]|nr:VWA domain-containing protein [Clostridiaceae bacterium]